MKLRLAQLKYRPAMLEAALQHGRPSACGQFVELDAESAKLVMKVNAPLVQPPNMPLSDKVELGLCGRHREAWVAAGRPLREEAAVADLKAICGGCSELQPGWTNGQREAAQKKHRNHPDVGLCRAWSCCHAGRRAATWECPSGKWPSGG